MKFSEARKIMQSIENAKKEINASVTAMGTLGLNHFVKSFRDQGFTDEALSVWKPRKRPDRGRYARKSGNRAILVKSGRLRRSLRRARVGSLSVKILSDVPYAKAHNEGLRAGRGSGFTMPKRQFVGDSGQLKRKIRQTIHERISKILK